VVVPLAGICAGGRPKGRSLPRPFRSVGARGVKSPRATRPLRAARGPPTQYHAIGTIIGFLDGHQCSSVPA
jgi:hypothetical protein